MTPRLSQGATIELERRVDELFNRLLTRLLGGSFSGKHLYITTDPFLSIPQLFAQAVTEEGGNLDHDLLQGIADVTKNLVDSQRATAKAVTVRRVNALLADVKAGRLKPEFFRNAVESELVDTWGRITSSVERVVNTESQHVVTMGLNEGITHINALRGIDDPVVGFLVKNDAALCAECRKVHLMPDGITPRLWYHSEVSADYHQRGEDKPSFHLAHPNCFTGDVRIFTDRGIVDIETLFREGGNLGVVVDDRVKLRTRPAHRGQFKEQRLWLDRHASGSTLKLASHVYDTGIQECYKILLDSGHSLTVSSGHEMWVDDDNMGAKVRADCLKVGDKVPLLASEGHFGTESFPELAELMGNCLGDGSVGRTQASWRFFGADIPYGQEIWRKARKLISLFQKGGPHLRQQLRVLPPSIKYNVASTGFASAILKQLMGARGLVDKKPRHVPSHVWLADKSTQSAFLRGLYAADGHSERTPSVVLAQNDFMFLQEIQLLLANFGIVARIFKHGDGGKKILTWADGTQWETDRKPCWRLMFGGWNQVKKFASLIGFGVPAKQARLDQFLVETESDNRLGSWRVAHITSIENVGLRQTYCLTEPETNTVTANGVVTGNCRCSYFTVIPSYGFDAGGRVTFIKDGFLELEYQRANSSLGGVEDRRVWGEVKKSERPLDQAEEQELAKAEDDWGYDRGGEQVTVPGTWWHGTPSGDLRGGLSGLHIGSKAAAEQALRARIGVPVEGVWDGTREYGKTLLAGRKTLLARGISLSGYNMEVPEEDHFPTFGAAKYSGGSQVFLHHKPNLFQINLVGPMSNTPRTPHKDFAANGRMESLLRRKIARKGYYYVNEGEDAGSVSAVLPGPGHVQAVIRTLPPKY